MGGMVVSTRSELLYVPVSSKCTDGPAIIFVLVLLLLLLLLRPASASAPPLPLSFRHFVLLRMLVKRLLTSALLKQQGSENQTNDLNFSATSFDPSTSIGWTPKPNRPFERIFIDIIPAPADDIGLTKESAFPCYLLVVDHFSQDSPGSKEE